MSPAEEKSAIQSVERAAKMLRMFTVQEPKLTLGELTQRLGMTKATVHRYTSALRSAGLLRSTGDGYALGPGVVELASAALAGLDVIRVAGPYLDGIVAETGESAVLSVWDGDAPVVVRLADNTEKVVRVVITTGSRLRTDSAQGLVFRAFLEDADGDPALERIRTDRIAFAERPDEGYAVLAAPVFQGDEVVATMAIVGMSAVIGRSTDSPFGRALRDAAERLSGQLGFVETEARE